MNPDWTLQGGRIYLPFAVVNKAKIADQLLRAMIVLIRACNQLGIGGMTHDFSHHQHDRVLHDPLPPEPPRQPEAYLTFASIIDRICDKTARHTVLMA